MDLDVVEERSSLAQDEPVPIQRAKRTYGSKAKPQTVQGDLFESSGLSSSFGAIPETDRAIAESMATFTASVYRPDLQLELKKIDEDYRVSDDEDENVDFRVRPSTSLSLSRSGPIASTVGCRRHRLCRTFLYPGYNMLTLFDSLRE